MATKESISTGLARDLSLKYPNTPTLTLAKRLAEEFNFMTVEQWRTKLRMIRGQKGKRNKENMTDKSGYRPAGKSTDFHIPEPECEDWKPYVMPVANNSILHIQDVHCPYHSKQTLELAVQYGISKNVNTLLIGYDFIDFYALSRFEKDPRARSVKYEIETANKILDYFQNKMPNVQIYWRNGNHDERLIRFLRVKAPELLDMEILSISELLRFGERGIIQIPDKQIVFAGNLAIIHGHEYAGGNGSSVNPARGLFLKATGSALCGHSHKSSEHCDPNINGDVFTTYSVGCACGLHPEYARLNKWNNGFAHILTYPDGVFHVNNMKVINGKIV